MKTCTTYMLVAAIAVAGLGMSTRAADVTPNTNNTGAQLQQTGSQMVDESTAKEIRETLAKVINDGLEKNKFNSFLGYMTKADRDRDGSASKSNLDALNTTLAQFRQDFKSKYNQEFDISADNIKDAMIYAGQDKKSATISFVNPAQSSNQPMASGNLPTANSDKSANTAGETKNANNAAMASLTLNLINEGHLMNEWRINAPLVSLEQIKQNLTRHIQMLDDQKAAWPSDVNQAYQAAAYHVLEAFNDTTMASDR